MANPRFSVQPMQGQPLPSNWRENAPKRAAMAEAAYLHNLQNAWKQGSQNADPNFMRSARLSSNGKGLSQEELAMRARLNNNGAPSWEDIYGQK